MNIPNFATKRAPEALDTILYDTILKESHEQLDLIAPSAEDDYKVALLLVDYQIDFCHPSGSLYIQGVLNDIKNLTSFIYHNLEHITTIIVSADSHMPQHIFFAPWWINEMGEYPDPFTIISYDDIVSHTWLPAIDSAASKEYVKKLESMGKKQLCIWPCHCLIGTLGQKLMPAVAEAIIYHSFLRTTNPIYIEKGTTAQSEYYGIFYPEVPVTHHHQVEINEKLFDILMAHDRVYIAGESKSHCVLETIKQIALHDRTNKTSLLKKVVLLDDCCSVLHHPHIDFASLIKPEYTLLQNQGLHISTAKKGIEI
jgi:nicotinamidase-related amidase